MVVKRPSRRTLVFGLVVTALSVSGLVYGMLGEDVSAGMRALGIGLGAFGIFIGLAAIAPRLVRPLAHVVGLPAARLGGVGRTARAGERRAQSGQDGVDGGRADDRPDARLVRRRLRQGAARERRERAPQAARHEPRDHVAERLGHRADRGRRGRRRRARRRRQLVDSRRPRQAARRRRRRGGRQRRRPRDDRQGVQLRVGRGLRRPRWRRSAEATRSSARARATWATRSGS